MPGYPAPPPAPLDDDLEELLMEEAEHYGRAMDSAVCPECPDPGLCMAERDCPRGDR